MARLAGQSPKIDTGVGGVRETQVRSVSGIDLWEGVRHSLRVDRICSRTAQEYHRFRHQSSHLSTVCTSRQLAPTLFNSTSTTVDSVIFDTRPSASPTYS